MNLYLVRHGEAKPKEEAPERPLSEWGRIEVMRVAAFVSEHTNVRVKNILHSGKLRARQTAEILAEFLKPLEGVHETSGLEPLADVSVWADRLSEGEEDVLLVGHMPYLGRLAGLLLSGRAEDEPLAFRSGGIACLVRDDTGTWSVGWAIHPGVLSSHPRE
ncbi:MAG: hypothetical protein AMJ46_11285 [Latescibacteria bacterium DG_63]|nr:MAG: hypothetical protein AMJ46_11285 [Latescibacteria bacterium DG_63]